MRLKARKGKRNYKTDKGWLDAVYRNNKELINDKLKFVGEKNKGKVFRQLIDDIKKKNKVNTYKAVQIFGKSQTFAKERFQENIYKALKNDKEVMKQFRKSIGWKNKVDISKFKWNYKEQAYTYDNVVILVSQSPPSIKVIKS